MSKKTFFDKVWDEMKSSSLLPGVDEIRLPGERLHRVTTARRADGIPIPAQLRANLDKMAANLGIDPL